MSNIASVLKAEIVRLARREIRGELASLRKTSSQHRSTIVALKREVQQLRQQLRSSARTTRASAPAAKEGELKLRFRPAGLAAHRKKLGLSAQDYGSLVDVSGQTIYHWEDGQRPRAAQLQALAGVRGIGKREAAKRLAALAENAQEPARKPAKRRAK